MSTTIQTAPDPAGIKLLKFLPSWLVYFVTGRRIENIKIDQKTEERQELRRKQLFMYNLITQLKRQSGQIVALKKQLEEVKSQNTVVVRTLRDIHLVLTTLTTQGSEQKSELFELRKRLTDFHEDTVGKVLFSRSKDLVESSSYGSGSWDEAEAMESGTSSVVGQPIEYRRISNTKPRQ